MNRKSYVLSPVWLKTTLKGPIWVETDWKRRFLLGTSIWPRKAGLAIIRCLTTLKGLISVKTDSTWRFWLHFSNWGRNAVFETVNLSETGLTMTVFAWLLKLTQQRTFDYDKMSKYPQKADLSESGDFGLIPRVDSETQCWLRQAM